MKPIYGQQLGLVAAASQPTWVCMVVSGELIGARTVVLAWRPWHQLAVGRVRSVLLDPLHDKMVKLGCNAK
ncbi:hypothetical protein GCM10027568_09500 [Humibacter soli]